MISGVYRIYNKESKIIYIGESMYIDYRIEKHKKMLRDNAHSNYKLQQYYNDGVEFEFELVAEINKDDLRIEPLNRVLLLRLEKKLIDDYKKLGWTVLNIQDSYSKVINGYKQLDLFRPVEFKQKQLDYAKNRVEEYFASCKIIDGKLVKC